MKRKIVVFALMVVIVAGLLVLGRFRESFRGKFPAVARPAATASRGHAAPDFTLTDLKGQKVTLSELHGKTVVLNFWATWCPPCKEEIPWFVELQKRYGAEGLQVIGVAMDDGDQKDVEKFVAEQAVNYPILLGKEKVAALYGGIDYLPTTFYIDRNGVVLDRVFGEPGREQIEQNVKSALAGKPKS